MIRKLRIKFIVLSMLAVLVLLAAIVAAMNITNYNSVISEADEVLAVLSENKGSFPQFGRKNDNRPPEMNQFEDTFESGNEDNADLQQKSSQSIYTSEMFPTYDDEDYDYDDDERTPEYDDYDTEDIVMSDDYEQEGIMSSVSDDIYDDMFDDMMEAPDDQPDGFLGGGKMSPETPYESRFFSVLLDETGNAVETEVSRIKAVDEDTAVEYAVSVLSSGSEKGFIKNYRYIKCSESAGTRIIFLDYGRKLAATKNFMLISILMAVAGYVIFFFVIVFFSKKMIRPVVESYAKQKRFITDAGHEIKTPLTIIRADADILEMDLGENEWLDDIQKQTERLTDLTNDLIYLARTEETVDTTQLIEFPLSDIVEEVATSFQGPAKAQNKNYTMEIQPMLSLKGDEKKIGQLVGILLDNALKYSPENGTVSIRLEKQNKNTILTVFNDTSEPVSKENLDRLFDRFYRADSSRNSKTGGYGIGLSMARAIVDSHGGKIAAKTDDGKSLKMIVTF